MPSRVQPEAEPDTSINPYSVLSLPTDAIDEQIKKAYRRAALLHHPDKVPSDQKDAAHKTFQQIALACAVLSDPRRRRRYDATGSTSESLLPDGEEDDFDWLSFFRTQWDEAITPELIERDRIEYIESGEQKAAMLEAYTKFKGDINKVFEHVMHADVLRDEESFRGWIDEAIKAGDVESFKKYAEESESAKVRRRKKAEKEAREAEELGKEMDEKKKKKGKNGDEGQGDLAALIRSKNANGAARQSKFLEHLEEKYAQPNGKEKKGKKRGPVDEPREEAFAATAEKMKKGKKLKGGK